MDCKQVLNQMGGISTLKMMIGICQIVNNENDNSMTFKFRGSRKFNCCKIRLTGMDLYDVSFFRLSPSTFEVKKQLDFEGLYFDQLVPTFEETTGLYLHF